ncbi:EPIDERMAL PATTERNING FACTOR-like protein 1 [Sesamum indicum]|uniref:Epidermal patterning factor-like protein n=1 Tax=Sesamum indicum TaxID=4182 RepID=A0A6I9UGF0_SESIN|nr:EPIDERMAL PATTERNING FACTOR-like protein 1 [Sesamum indicum]
MAIPSPISTTLISPKSIPLILALFVLIFSPSSYSSKHKHSSNTFRGFEVEKKARLGSTPPSCHNKCNQCHPCTPVQVPTLPQGHRSSARENPSNYHSSSAGEMYSNYKPLGWKCRCGGRFYNPN